MPTLPSSVVVITVPPVPTLIFGTSTSEVSVLTPVIEPDPLIDTDMTPPYTIVQTEPAGIVTVAPALIVIGPALMAFFPEVIV